MRSLSRVLKAAAVSLGSPREIRARLGDQGRPSPVAGVFGPAGAAALTPAGLQPPGAEGMEAGEEPAGQAAAAPAVPDPVAVAREEAEALLAAARSQAEQILTEAREQAAQELEKARLQGREEGRREVLAPAQAEAAAILEEARAALAEAEEEGRRMIERSKEDLVRVATTVAARIVRRELAIRPETVVGLVAEALAGLKEDRTARVRAHPGDVVLLESRRAELLRSAPGMESLEFQGDEAMEPGGVMIETEHGQVDARVETQLGNLAASMMEVVRDGN
ncbi:MAG: flagellar assembly protein FliH [Acetobacteraceae bacterium]|nr:flagellar assembly protein FliH [Acetobacteraceae bacterium]